jgi:hypothetical protein
VLAAFPLSRRTADCLSSADLELDTGDISNTCEACGSASSTSVEQLKATIGKAEAELASSEALQYSGESFPSLVSAQRDFYSFRQILKPP